LRGFLWAGKATKAKNPQVYSIYIEEFFAFGNAAGAKNPPTACPAVF
jgi:hypothetical protein